MACHLADQLVHVVPRVLQPAQLRVDGHGRVSEAEERVEDKV